MGIAYWTDSITFSSDQTIHLEEGSIVVVVGPNNAGKSSLLREIHRSFLSAGDRLGPVTKKVTFKHRGTVEDLKVWTSEHLEARELSGGQESQLWGFNHVALWSHLANSWRNGDGLRALRDTVLVLADATTRLSAANPAPAINFVTDAVSHPIHALYKDDAAEGRLRSGFRKAFGMDLMVNRCAGNAVPLLCGTAPQPSPGEDRLSMSYVRRLALLPPLAEQGDGMRSFVGCMLSTSVPTRFVVLIDEPEAFLHPPQARLLGTMLAREKPAHRQLFISTHSGDVLRGLLDAGSTGLRIVRIRRAGERNVATQLDPAEIETLWSDPILRFSNILDGLFHERVVICEGDADCRFYSAIVDATSNSTPMVRRPDLMFASSGGKDRIPTIARALTKLGVPTSVVADFDVLREEHPLRNIFGALGGDWSSIEADWRAVKTAIEHRSPPLTSTQVRSEVETILNGVVETTFPREAAERIKQALKASSPWGPVKLAGVHALPNGQPMTVARRLLTALRSRGLFVVECGELERFVPSAGGHGPGWIPAVLTRDLASDPELEQARLFMRDLVAFSPDFSEIESAPTAP